VRCCHFVCRNVGLNFFAVGVIAGQRGMHLGKRQMLVLEGNFLGDIPRLYQPTIPRTVSPVPAIFGRPPRIAGSRSISVPISTLANC